jgi:hypothetical protein
MGSLNYAEKLAFRVSFLRCKINVKYAVADVRIEVHLTNNDHLTL